jgi:hypothetical protein
MRRAWLLACWSFVGGSIAIACGGSNDSGLFGSSGDPSASSSGTTSSGATSSGTTSSGGSSGTTSSGGSSGTTSSGGTGDAGVDAGKSCRRDNAAQDCASGEYCKVTSCADKGICTKKPDPGGAQGNVICGCDGITYYSPELAASFGVSVNPAFANECEGNAAKTCSGASPCPNGRYCNYATTVDDITGLCDTALSGVCWGVPNNCPAFNGSGTTPVAMDCASGDCSTFCQAIKSQKPWFGTTANKCN